jgi:hypothetical protein
MKWLEWRLKRLALHLAPLPVATLGMLSVAGALWLGGVHPLERQVADARIQVLRPSHAPVESVQANADVTRQQELDAFDKMFPEHSALLAQLETLFDIVEKSGLAIDKGEYSLTERPGKHLRRFEAQFPVEGHYLQIRRMLDEALKELPAMALVEIALERSKISDSRLQAQLRFVIFVRKQR